MSRSSEKKLRIREDLRKIMRRIGRASRKYGVKCYAVGGLVRDALLGRESDDLDVVCTDIDPVVEHLKREEGAKELTEEKGIAKEKFLTRILSFDKGIKVDFAEPRKEEYTEESHKPVVGKGKIEDDVMRRDFTVNTLMLRLSDKEDYTREDIEDLTGRGLRDLEEKRLDTVGEPIKVFTEDPTRILRAVRFAAALNMKPTGRVKKAIRRKGAMADPYSDESKKIPKEQVYRELKKGAKYPRYFVIMEDLGLLGRLFPEVKRLEEIPIDRKYHPHSRNNLEHTLKYVEVLKYPDDAEEGSVHPSVFKIAGLLHDIGKAETSVVKEGGRVSAIGHAGKSAEMSEKILRRLAFPKREIADIVYLVGKHMTFNNLSNSPKVKDSTLRKLASESGKYLPFLREMALADLVDAPEDMKKEHRRKILLLYNRAVRQPKVVKPAISGKDIMKELGVPSGPIVGKILKKLNDAIFRFGLKNERKVLLEWIRSNREYLMENTDNTPPRLTRRNRKKK